MEKVSYEMKIGISSRRRIHPSFGFMGIVDGKITVKNICHYNDIPDRENATDGWFDGAEDDELKNATWVCYHYDANQNIPTEDVDPEHDWWMPLEIFVDHVTCL